MNKHCLTPVNVFLIVGASRQLTRNAAELLWHGDEDVWLVLRGLVARTKRHELDI